ncbi:MAG TPA: glycosyltransferase family 2 protein [Candidatus Rubrimentiphilum sp.]|nr:glycosyltransferase family 2 protein [Candidatus Rubrimentiphilum sp.]
MGFDTGHKHSSARAFRAGLVSIVTPTLHAARFFRETVESVLSQTYTPIEYIVVDGGSSDETASIARSAEDKLTFLSAPGLNQAQAINYGFARATGEFFTFLNADDTLYPHAIESAVAALRGAPNAPFVYGEGLHVDSLGRPIGSYPSLPFSKDALAKECFICQPATLVRSQALAAVRGLDEHLETAFDYDLWIRLSAEASPVRVDELWATSRMHTQSKSMQHRAVVYGEVFAMMRKYYGYVPFNWIHAYAGYMLEGKDFFAPPAGSPRRTLLTLRVGLRENRRHWTRFLREFTIEVLRLKTAAIRGEGA